MQIYAVALLLRHVTRRTLRRALGGQVLWSGNQERLRPALLSRDSLILYALRTHRRRRRDEDFPLPRLLCLSSTVCSTGIVSSSRWLIM